MGGRWAMLTLTVRHHRHAPLSESLRVLTQAWRRLRKSGCVARAWTAAVAASVRALEVTYGQNGWHPHLHVLVRLSDGYDHVPRGLSDLEQWARAVEHVGGAAYVPERGIGVRWSAPREASGELAARYASKLGWEATGAGKPSARSPWAILERAAGGDDPDDLWGQYVRATHGRRAIELDDRAAAAACRARYERSAERCLDSTEMLEGSAAGVEIVRVEREEVSLLRRFESVEPSALELVLRDAERIGAATALSIWLARAEAWERSRFRRAA